MPRTYTQLHYHIVFATKHRHPFITTELRDDLYSFIAAALGHQGGKAISIGGMPDHVHLLAGLKAHPSIAEIVKSIKGGSSKWINDNRRANGHFAWQEGYAAFTVSRSSLPSVRSYVERQEEHHGAMSFRDEMVTILRRHEISFREVDLDF